MVDIPKNTPSTLAPAGGVYPSVQKPFIDNPSKALLVLNCVMSGTVPRTFIPWTICAKCNIALEGYHERVCNCLPSDPVLPAEVRLEHLYLSQLEVMSEMAGAVIIYVVVNRDV